MWDMKRRSAWVTLVVIITVQCSVMAYWATQKANLFLDEYLSLSCAHTAAVPLSHPYDFPANPTWQVEQWVNVPELREFLVVEWPESAARSLENFTHAVTKVRSYYVLLNLLESILCPGEIGIGVALGFNIVVFAVGQVVLYALAREVGSTRWAALLAAFMYGSGTMAISHAVYVRFYVWVILLLLVVLLLHAKMWSCDVVWKNLLMEVASLVLIYLALRNSELVLIFCGVLIVGFGAGLVLRGRRVQAAYYLTPIFLVAIAYLTKKTSFVDYFLHPELHVNDTWPAGMMAENVITSTPATVIGHLGWCFDRLGWMLFGSVNRMRLMLGAALVMLVAVATNAASKTQDKTQNETITEDEPSSPARSFVLVLALVVALYLLFASVTRLPMSRYLMQVFPVASIVFWFCMGELASRLGYERVIAAACLVVVIANATMPFRTRRIEYLYENDKPLISSLEAYSDTDVICVYGSDYASPMAYDCIYLCGDDVRIYPVTDDAHDIDVDSCPDTVLVWTLHGFDAYPYVDELASAGYTFELLGSTHESDVYVFTRQS